MAKEKPDELQKASSAKGSRAERLSAIASGARQKYKGDVCVSVTNNRSLLVPRVSTGIMGLDLKTNGGLPMNRVTAIYGPKSSSKTTLLLRAVGNAQKLCANCYKPGVFEKKKIMVPDIESGGEKEVLTNTIVSCSCGKPKDIWVLWMDAENVWLTEWSERMGVNVDTIILSRPIHSEQAFNTVVSYVESGEIDIVVIDSLAAMAPEVESSTAMEAQQQGASARTNNKFLRKLVGAMNKCFQDTKRSPTIWMINQYREKIGVMFGNPETLPGGKGQLFVTTMEIECRAGKVSVNEDDGMPTEAEFKCTIKKNKVGPPGGKVEYKMALESTEYYQLGDVLEHDSVIDTAVDMGIIEHPTNVTYVYDGKKYRGKGEMTLFFYSEPDEYASLKNNILMNKLKIEE